MLEQPRRGFPILGVAAGTPLLTPNGLKCIEDIKPGDVIQAQDDDQDSDCEHGTRWWECT